MIILLFYYRIKGELKMPDISKMKSVAVPIKTYEKLIQLKSNNSRSIASQISFLVELASHLPSERDLMMEGFKREYKEKFNV